MNIQSRNIPLHYEYIYGDALQFVETSNRPVVVFGRSNRKTPILLLAASGMDVYKQTICRCAQKYAAITCKKEKTSYSSYIVTELVSKGFLFIEKAGDQFILYNMDNAEAFKKIRLKVRQAMMDFLRKKAAVSMPETSILELQGTGPDLPEISIVEFQNEGPVLLGRDLMNVFDAPLDPEITQVHGNMNITSQEDGGAYNL